MTKNAYDIIRNPLITEKGANLAEKENKYLFNVACSSTKKDVKEAIEKIYSVKVLKVHTMNVRGKLKRVRYKEGRTSSWKKAVVTLKAGDKIEFV
jgi:large subunit ribosomal protein L23